jgi:predicted aspartyl protease
MNGTGAVFPFPFITIRLLLGTAELRADALVDTGFDGMAVVPQSLILEIPDDYWEQRWTLADNSVVLCKDV